MQISIGGHEVETEILLGDMKGDLKIVKSGRIWFEMCGWDESGVSRNVDVVIYEREGML